ncbi:hypothetical protein FB45DRAFT_936442 [Roridomyces roridus]|uniref:F-box domain-containing protein n=1 Tax=Roridomyces roridus TaxID=1738132 RepID=A0AAD7BAU0_9AGAR|nr:hypothetical protein FB45DRAFT_936442 [Roridomyces roridus]
MPSLKDFLANSFTSAPRQKVPAANLLAQDLLPVELWDEIFSLVIDDDDLLRAARVCKVFNIICIHLHLARHQIPSLAESHSQLQVKSAALPALLLSGTALRADRLGCHFDTDLGIQRGLAALRHIISRSDTLGRVDLAFDGDLSTAYERDTSVPEPLRSQWRILHEFCGALSAMALKVPAGKVVVILRGALYGGHAVDVAGWNWYKKPQPPVPPLMQRISLRKQNIRAETPPPRLPCTVPPYPSELRLHYVQNDSVSMHVYNINSVSMHSPSEFTLFVFNGNTIDTLDLSASPISARLLSSLLRTLEFPALATLVVSDGIAPDDWTAFLLRHPALKKFQYVLDHDTAPLALEAIQPIVHPGLRELHADGISNIERAMAALGSSPSLSVLHFTIYPSAAERLRTLSPVLRLIAQWPADLLPVNLALEIRDGNLIPHHVGGWRGARLAAEHCFFIDDEATAIARSLYCVHGVTITCWTGGMGRAALTWLALLPALRRADFALYLEELPRGRDDGSHAMVWQNEYEKFKHTAMAALPGVQIEVHLY